MLSMLHIAECKPYLIVVAAPVNVGHAACNYPIYPRLNSASLPVFYSLTEARPCRSSRSALASSRNFDLGGHNGKAESPRGITDGEDPSCSIVRARRVPGVILDPRQYRFTLCILLLSDRTSNAETIE